MPDAPAVGGGANGALEERAAAAHAVEPDVHAFEGCIAVHAGDFVGSFATSLSQEAAGLFRFIDVGLRVGHPAVVPFAAGGTGGHGIFHHLLGHLLGVEAGVGNTDPRKFLCCRTQRRELLPLGHALADANVEGIDATLLDALGKDAVAGCADAGFLVEVEGDLAGAGQELAQALEVAVEGVFAVDEHAAAAGQGFAGGVEFGGVYVLPGLCFAVAGSNGIEQRPAVGRCLLGRGGQRPVRLCPEAGMDAPGGGQDKCAGAENILLHRCGVGRFVEIGVYGKDVAAGVVGRGQRGDAGVPPLAEADPVDGVFLPVDADLQFLESEAG